MFPTLSPSQMRLSGWLLFAGSLLLIIVNLISLSIPSGNSTLPSIPLSILELIGGLLVAGGLPATYLKQRKEVATLGLIGFLLLWISSLLITVLLSGYAIYFTATTPPLANHAKVVVPVFIQYIASTGILQIIGTMFYGVTTMRARVFTNSSGLFLVAAVVVSLPQLFIRGSITSLIGLFGTFLLLGGLASMGFFLARSHDYDEDEPQEEEEQLAPMKDYTS